MLKTVIANLRQRKLRLLATGIAVLLGVMFTSGTLVLTDSMSSTFDQLFSDVYKGTAAVVRSDQKVDLVSGNRSLSTRARVPATLVDRLRSVDGVADAQGQVGGYAQMIDKKGKAIGNPNNGPPVLGGRWDPNPVLNPYHLASGHAPADDSQVVIDSQTSHTYGFAVGDRVDVLTDHGRVTKTVSGISRFGKAKSPGGATVVDFTTAEAQRLLGKPGQFSEILVQARPGVSEDQVVRNIEAAHLPQVEAITGKSASAESKKEATRFVSFFSTFLLVFGAIALLVGAFIIANTFSILVAQRTRELALLRALGASRKQVLGSVVAEAFVVGLAASAVGLLLGLGAATGLLSLFVGSSGLSTSTALTSRTVVLSFAIGIGITVLSAILPARRASKVPPVTAMRDVAIERVRNGKVRAAVGLVLLVGAAAALAAAVSGHDAKLVGVGAVAGLAGAVVFGPTLATVLGRGLGRLLRAQGGVAAQLGQENVLRNPKRTASTASALMIGATLVCAIAVFAASAIASIDKMVNNDYTGAVVITSSGNGIPLSVVDDLARHPELGTVTSFSFVPASVNGQTTAILATDPARYTSVVDLHVQQGDITKLGSDGLAVSRVTADSRHLAMGSRLEVRYVNGSTHAFTVRAIYGNQNFGGDMLGNRSGLAEGMIGPVAEMAFVGGGRGMTPTQVKARVDALTSSQPTVKAQTAQQYKATAAAQMNTFLYIVYAMLGLAVFIAVVGVINTLGLSILERTRELGLLRAVGMTRGQLRAAVRTEALLISLTGVIVGVVLGTSIGSSLIKSIPTDQGLTGFAIPVPTLVVVLVAGVLVGLVAAVLPARRAARLDPLQALATE